YRYRPTADRARRAHRPAVGPDPHELPAAASAVGTPPLGAPGSANGRRPRVGGARKPLATRAYRFTSSLSAYTALASQLTSLAAVSTRYGPPTGAPNGAASMTRAEKRFSSWV